MTKLGATGEYPQGSLGAHDQGELALALASDARGNLIIDFGKEVKWIAMSSEQAIEFGKLILRKAGAKKIRVSF